MENNQQIEKKPKKKSHFVLLFWLFLIVSAFFGTKYLFNERNNYNLFKKPVNDNFANLDSKIYDKDSADNADAKNSYQTQVNQVSEEDADHLASFNKNEFSPKDLYGVIIKQQLQIDVLSDKYIALKGDLEKVRNQDKLSKIIISFIEVKDCVNARTICANQIENLSLLAKSDTNLEKKITNLKEVLKTDPKTSQQLQLQFENLIPNIFSVNVTSGITESFFDKIKRYITRIIVIRRVDGMVKKSSENIDFVVVEIQKLIANQDYQKALDLMNNQDEKYKKVWAEFALDLKNANDLDIAINDIFEYLKAF